MKVENYAMKNSRAPRGSRTHVSKIADLHVALSAELTENHEIFIANSST